MRMTASYLRHRLAVEHGFTMVTVMVGMLAVMLISVAAVTAAGGDIGLARYDQDDKQAYAAAEAGVNDYLGQLSGDSDYWTKCTNVPAPGAVNDKGVSNANRKWRAIPGSDAEYSIELIPRSKREGETAGPAKCDPENPVDSMVEDGNIKIRVTGRTNDNNKNVRTLNATFRPDGFLDFLYYTNLENQDPRYIQRTLYPLYDTENTNGTTPEKLIDWAGDKCQRYWYGSQTAPGGSQGRGQMPEWKGRFNVGGGYYYPSYSVTLTTANELDINEDPNPPRQPPICGEITFISGDEVNGPFHSNDEILISGNPSFGTPDGDDKVEVAVPDDGSSTAGWRGSGTPQFHTSNGKLKAGAQTLKPPVTNQSLKGLAQPGYSFTGQTSIALNGTQMTVKTGSPATTTTKPLPPNGVIYVGNGTCGEGYDPNDPEKQPAGCGDVRISGNYSRDLTIAAANDIVVTGTTKRTTDDNEALLGLIADGFVRVWHPVNATKDSYGQYDSCSNRSDSPDNVQIDAAILTLTGSFTVDNYWCGANLGNLTVNGAIAQNHRGVVGRGSSGYTKKYNYNEDLKFRSPPYFLDPVQSAWRILRQGEQSPPCVKTTTACP